MTEVAFHFGAPDRLAYTCRLLRKAVASGARLVVRADPATTRALDVALWSVGPVDFVSHCEASAPLAMQARSAVLLAPTPTPPDAARPVLVNLAEDIPDGFEHFQRVIEVVSTDEQDRGLARRRWKQYTERGYTITRHDLTSRAGE